MIALEMLRRFEDLIRARAGIHMRPQEAAVLQKILQNRTDALRMANTGVYLDFLCQNSAPAGAEWKQLFVLLTNQESYFFRDADQLGVIRAHLLPSLLRANRETRSLRIWSAGCSTGEEPYTLAMMLADVAELHDWKVSILASDLSESALDRARRGVYGAWSFRALDETQKKRFFVPRGKEWEVAPFLRQNISFVHNNLFGDEFPSRAGEIHDMDLILCRNVFIYFGRDAIAQVLKKFGATLRAGGFLVCGHAELHDVPLGAFKARAFPQSLAYQREIAGQTEAKIERKAVFPAARPVTRAVAESKITAPPAPKVVASPKIAPFARVIALPAKPVATSEMAGTAPLLEEARSQIRAGNPAAQQTLIAFLETAPKDVEALCLLAQAQANAGQLDAAEASCARALGVSPFAALPYHLRARIAEERGDSAGAKMLLKKVIYLHPRSVWAPLELSAIYEREGEIARAAQMQRAALEILAALDENSPVPAEEYAVEAPLSVGELRRQLAENAGGRR